MFLCFLQFIMVNSCLFSSFCFHFCILKKRRKGGRLIVMVLSVKKVDRLLSESNTKKKNKTCVSWKIKIDSNLFHLFSFLSFFPDNVINLLLMFLFLPFIMVNCCLFSTFCFHFRILKKEQGGRGALILMVREKNNKTGQFSFTLFYEESW